MSIGVDGGSGVNERAAGPRALVEGGRLRGGWEGPVAVFRGVPFGAPPVGPWRWRPPRRPEGWEGERPALEFGPAPLQPQPPRDSIMFHANFDDRRPLVISEDCLYLNVWTPDPSPVAALPVMVWIHGGGNRYGHGSQDIHDGRSMAGRGIVIVTLNHRLGALGFLAHPELAAEDELGASGNYGLLDIVAALTWVRDNIAAFGGDPAKVTLAGNSAGAAHICHLMAAPATRTLFRAAIGQSASGIHRAEGLMPDQAAAQERGRRYAEEFGGRDLAGLRRVSGVELILKGHFGPVVDGRLLTRDTQHVFAAGGQHPFPLLVGTNTDEGSVYTPPGAAAALAARSAALSSAALNAAVADGTDKPAGRAVVGSTVGAGTPDPDQTGSSGVGPGSAGPAAGGGNVDGPNGTHPVSARDFRDVYPTGDPFLAAVSARLFTGETRFVYPVWRWAVTHAQTSGAPTWVYRFARTPPLPAGLNLAPPPDGIPGYGVFHTAELAYTWDNLRQKPWPWEDVDRELAAAMGDAWARFVIHGDPNGGGPPFWDVFTGHDDSPVLVFGDDGISPGVTDRIAALRLLDRLPRPL